MACGGNHHGLCEHEAQGAPVGEGCENDGDRSPCEMDRRVRADSQASTHASSRSRSGTIRRFGSLSCLGAETVVLSGANVVQELLTYARMRNVAKIIVGKPVRARWKEVVFGSVVADLVQQSGETDIYVITGEAGESRPLVSQADETDAVSGHPTGLARWASCISTALAWLMFPYFNVANLIMVYLMGVVVRGDPLWTRAVGPRINPECRGVRLFLCPSVSHLCRVGHSVSPHVCRHVGRGADDQRAGRPDQATG